MDEFEKKIAKTMKQKVEGISLAEQEKQQIYRAIGRPSKPTNTRKYMTWTIATAAVALFFVLLMPLLADQKNVPGLGTVPDTSYEDLNESTTQAEVIEGDFIYRLVTEKSHYDEGEDVKIFAELEYVGLQDQVEINHGSSPFFFPMTETTRDYEIDYAVTMPFASTIVQKGEPIRQEIAGGGGYSEHNTEEYKKFMKQVMRQGYPSGHYIVNGYANFTLVGEKERDYMIEAQVEFTVGNS